MVKVHLNWSRCKNWDSVRSKLMKRFNCVGYGNFMDVELDNLTQLNHPDLSFVPFQGTHPIPYMFYEVKEKE